ncbi:MAG: hypothetical protein KatS3mg052_0758 [Candidatus Roseilinea sp.]|nr:MAG: hypothetical protein KatS3mg052_0758 [Candidatus Roseilinea sp.]
MKTGSRVRVRGHGGKNARGQAGDLYLVIEVKPHPTYERKDDDLYRDMPVDAFTAMLGGEAQVDTLAGPIAVKVPPGTSSGKLIRVRGRGMPKLNKPGEYGRLVSARLDHRAHRPHRCRTGATGKDRPSSRRPLTRRER